MGCALTALAPQPRTSDTSTETFELLRSAAQDREPVTGWTHNFYRYPARFSPRFAAAAIKAFSRPGQVVLDPYMGGGTAVVEGLVAGRRVVGNDLNSLAAFVARVKTTPLEAMERRSVRRWADREVPKFTYRVPSWEIAAHMDPQGTRNLGVSRARFVKKVMAAALASVEELPTPNARDFARCAILGVGQWALDGRGQHTPLGEFRSKLALTTQEMLQAIARLARRLRQTGGSATILNYDACTLEQVPWLCEAKGLASLVITSPPYPGVHVLYHRWQVDGRRETPAPYWIAGCIDGRGASFYTFGDRRANAASGYFRRSLLTLRAIRKLIRDDGWMIQMVAFSKPAEQLPSYLENMRAAGFVEFTADRSVAAEERIWREVPHRKWHATLNGKTDSASEVVLVHRPV